MLSEFRRELFWAKKSWLTAYVVLACALFGIWVLSSAVTFERQASETFEASSEAARENGVSVEEALKAPVVVTKEAGVEVVDNALRHDFETMIASRGVLTGFGMVTNGLSVACVLLLPACGIVVGMVSISHDRRTGGIVLRWPQAPGRVILAAKAILGGAVMVGAVGTVALIAGVAGMIISQGEGARPVEAPSVIQVAVLAGYAIFVGCISVLVGMFVGTIHPKMTVALVVFFVAYYLMPLGGVWDPREWITSGGASFFVYVGELRLGGRDASLGSIGLLGGLGLLAGAGTCGLWRARSRMPCRGGW